MAIVSDRLDQIATVLAELGAGDPADLRRALREYDVRDIIAVLANNLAGGNGDTQTVRRERIACNATTPDIAAGILAATLADGESLVATVVEIPVVFDGNQPLITAYAAGTLPTTDDLVAADAGTPDTQEIGSTLFSSSNIAFGFYANGGAVPLILRLVSQQADAITAINQGTKTFTVAGDQTATYPAAGALAVVSSTGNDGAYSIVSSTHSIGPDTTDVVVAETIPDDTLDGNLTYGDPGSSSGEADLLLVIADA